MTVQCQLGNLNKIKYFVIFSTHPAHGHDVLVGSQDWVVVAVYSWWWLPFLYLLNVKKVCRASIVQNPDPATTCNRSLLSSQGVKGLLSSTIPLWWKCMYSIHAVLLSEIKKYREASNCNVTAISIFHSVGDNSRTTINDKTYFLRNMIQYQFILTYQIRSTVNFT